MSEQPTSGYLFLPHLRSGLSAYLPQQPAGSSASTAKHAVLDVALKLDKYNLSGEMKSELIRKTISLYGPGEIVSFDPSAIKIHDPVDYVSDYETSFFPTIEFWDPEYPWRYTPFASPDNGKLMPWLTLIVLVAENSENVQREFEHVGAQTLSDQSNKQSLPFIRNVSVQNLPDLNEAWRWAHVHIMYDDSKETPISNESIINLLESQPEQITSRLLCARRLQPGVLYNAFLVPTFKLSMVAAGLAPADELTNMFTLAWDSSGGGKVNLPYYFRWEFRTGERDFEKLVKDLVPRVLTKIGLRKMGTLEPSYGFTGPDSLNLESALQTLDTEYDQWGHDSEVMPWQAEELQNSLEMLLNRNADTLEDQEIEIPALETTDILENAHLVIKKEQAEVNFTTSSGVTCAIRCGETAQLDLYENDLTEDQITHKIVLDDLIDTRSYRLKIVKKTGSSWETISTTISFIYHKGPLVTPPLYGQWHAKKKRVSTNMANKNWFHTLNLDPRHRAAAGVGAEIIRKKQEELMASAWEQAGDIDFANMIIKRYQLGVQVSNNTYGRLKGLSPEDFLMNSRILHKRCKVTLSGKNVTVSAHVKSSRIPKAALDPAFRRITRKFGPLKKRMRKMGFKTGPHILTSLNDPDNPFRAAGPHPTPAGTVNMCEVIEKIRDKYIPDQGKDEPNDGPELCIIICRCCYCSKHETHEIHYCCQCLRCQNLKYPEGFEVVPFHKIDSLKENETKIIQSRTKSFVATAQKPVDLLSSEASFEDIDQFRKIKYCSEELVEYFEKIRDKVFKPDDEIPSINAESTTQEKQKALIYTLPDLLRGDVESPLVPPLNIKEIHNKMIEMLDPAITIANRVRTRLQAPFGALEIIDLLKPAPKFPQAMYNHVRDISKDLICAGISSIKENTVAILSTNTRFIESLFLGLNHEMARELLWREYPTDQRGTYFKQFWEPIRSLEFENLIRTNFTEDEFEEKITELLEDIQPIDEWRSNQLGDNPSKLAYLMSENFSNGACENDENIVMVIRGNLLKKYPRTKIYIYKEKSETADTDEYFKRLVDTLNGSESDGEIYEPRFRADLPPDITCIGFNLRVCDILREKHYLIIEERIDRVRFGLDINIPSETSPQGNWDNLSWEHFGLLESFGTYLDATLINQTSNLPPNPSTFWNEHSANIAGITQQKPVRVAISLTQMIPASMLSEGST